MLLAWQGCPECGQDVWHKRRVRSIMVGNVLDGDSLPEIGLEPINAPVYHSVELILVPFDGIRVGVIGQAHASLPLISPVRAAVGFLHQVAFLVSFVK
jgi:hypothetical protein